MMKKCSASAAEMEMKVKTPLDRLLNSYLNSATKRNLSLEETIPYYGDLHLDAGTKKLILNMLRSIRSVVPVDTPPATNDPENERKNEDLDHIRNILVLARQHSEELEGLFNPEELFRYARYVSDYQDIMIQMEKTLEGLKTCRDSALKFATGMAEMVEGHIQMTTMTADNRQTGNQKIKKQESIRFSREGIKLKVV